jgi:hypothetical protein
MFWRLHRAPEQPEERLSLEHALRIITFARAVFTWAELQLVERSIAKQELNIWPNIERQPHDFTLPYLELDVDFFLTEEGVKVARLNEFIEPLEMSAREFALILLFDGTTTAREAEIVVYGYCSNDEESRNVDRLVSQVVRAGLSLLLKGESEYGADDSESIVSSKPT